MSKEYNDTENYYDQEIEFSYQGQDFFWYGDFTVSNWGEVSDWEYYGYSEQEVTIDRTDMIVIFNEEKNDWDEVTPTPSLLATVEIEIKKTL